MNLSSTCPNCQMQCRITPELVGQTLRCPKCQQPFTAVAGEPLGFAAGEKSPGVANMMLDELMTSPSAPPPMPPEPPRMAPVSAPEVAPMPNAPAPPTAPASGWPASLVVLGILCTACLLVGGLGMLWSSQREASIFPFHDPRSRLPTVHKVPDLKEQVYSVRHQTRFDAARMKPRAPVFNAQYYTVYEVRLEANIPYRFEAQSSAFRPKLMLLNEKADVLLEENPVMMVNFRNEMQSKLLYTPAESGKYYIVVVAFSQNAGEYIVDFAAENSPHWNQAAGLRVDPQR